MAEKKGISPEKLAFKKLLKNRIAQMSFGVILLITFIAILGPFVRPDHSPDANTQLLSISRMKPGASVDLLMVHKNENNSRPNFFTCLSEGGWDNCSDYIPLESWEIKSDSVFYKAKGEDEVLSIHLIDVLYHLGEGRFKKTKTGYSLEHFKDGELKTETISSCLLYTSDAADE